MQDETQTHPCWLCPADLGTPGRGDTWQRVPWCPHPSPKCLSGGMKSSQCLHGAHPDYCSSASARSCICSGKCDSRTTTVSIKQLLHPFSFCPFSLLPHSPQPRCCVPGVQPSIRPFLTRTGVGISCSKQFLCPLLRIRLRRKTTFANTCYD